MPKIRPISDLRNKANEISEFCHSEREPVFITEKWHWGHGGDEYRNL